MKKFKCIHVGLGPFSLQRLQINLNSDQFDVVAFVDIDIENSIKRLDKLKNLPHDYKSKVFKSITDAKKKFEAEVCFIYVASDKHPDLIIESLNNNLHTFCVKSISCDIENFVRIVKVKNEKKNLLLVQGLNNQWNEASITMQNILKDKDLFGETLFGSCYIWGRQNLKSENPVLDVTCEGIYFHSMVVHQLSQIIPTLGLPKSVYAVSNEKENSDIGFLGIRATSSGSCIVEFDNNKTVTYFGTRGGHGNPFGFASRWSGRWLFHGTKGDLERYGGRLSLYQNGSQVRDYYLKDLSDNLIEDEKKQFEIFYLNLTGNFEKYDLQKQSLHSWLMMEACNLSSKHKEKIYLEDLLKKCNINI